MPLQKSASPVPDYRVYNYNVSSSTHSTPCCHVSLELLHTFISVYVFILLKTCVFQIFFLRNCFLVNADADILVI